MKKKDWPKEYHRYYNLCQSDGISAMSPERWIKTYNNNPENMTRWNNARTAPSLWDKINKDPLYNAILKQRHKADPDGYVYNPESKSNRIEIRKRKKNET